MRSLLAAAALVVGLAGASVVGLRAGGALESLELAAYDWFIRLRPAPAAADSRIVLVTISDEDIRRLGQWPVSDDTLARALLILTSHGPRAIGIDLYRDVTVPPSSGALDSILAANRRIVGVTKFASRGSEGTPPHRALAGTDRVGFADVVVDRGGITRRALLFLDDGRTTTYSLALRLALLYLETAGIAPKPDARDPALLRLGPAILRPLEANDGPYVGADAAGYQVLLDFKAGHRPFATIPLSALFAESFDPGLVADRVVLLGTTAESVKDFFFTPWSHGRGSSPPMPGIALHGHAVSQFLRLALDGDRLLRTPTDWQEAIWIMLWSALGGAVGLLVRGPALFALAAAGALAVLGGIDFLAFTRGLWLPLVPPAVAGAASAALVTTYVSYRERQERATLMRLFSRSVSKEVAETLWRQRDELLEGGLPRPQRAVATVMFADLVGFTTLTEKLPPAVMMAWLEELMDAMTRRVIAHGGVIDKYIGDAIMALFGVPLTRTTEAEVAGDARAAVRCALALEATLVELNGRWRKEGRATTTMRIGIATGPLVAGTIGSAERADYTVIGDTVNIAARLESVDKGLRTPDPDGAPCRILIGESTLYHLGDEFEVERIGDMTLKGKEESIDVYRVIGRRGAAPAVGQEERP